MDDDHGGRHAVFDVTLQGSNAPLVHPGAVDHICFREGGDEGQAVIEGVGVFGGDDAAALEHVGDVGIDVELPPLSVGQTAKTIENEQSE